MAPPPPVPMAVAMEELVGALEKVRLATEASDRPSPGDVTGRDGARCLGRGRGRCGPPSSVAGAPGEEAQEGRQEQLAKLSLLIGQAMDLAKELKTGEEMVEDEEVPTSPSLAPTATSEEVVPEDQEAQSPASEERRGQCGGEGVEEAVMTAVTSPLEFTYVTKSRLPDLRFFHNQLQNLGAGQSRKGGRAASEGDEVLAWRRVGGWEEGDVDAEPWEVPGWARARVDVLGETTSIVSFVDFGNTGEVQNKELLPLKERYSTGKKAEFGVRACLSGVDTRALIEAIVVKFVEDHPLGTHICVKALSSTRSGGRLVVKLVEAGSAEGSLVEVRRYETAPGVDGEGRAERRLKRRRDEAEAAARRLRSATDSDEPGEDKDLSVAHDVFLPAPAPARPQPLLSLPYQRPALIPPFPRPDSAPQTPASPDSFPDSPLMSQGSVGQAPSFGDDFDGFSLNSRASSFAN